MNYLPLFVSLELSESDRRLLVVLIVFLLLTVAILGGIGYLVRMTMIHQGKRNETLCRQVLTSGVVNTEKHYIQYAKAKNAELYFKQSIIGVLIGFVALIVWLVCSGIFGTWGDNFFYHFFNDLFYVFGVNEHSTSVDFLNITIHSLVVINNDGKGPVFRVENIPFYVESVMFIVSFCWILVATQAYAARFIAAQKFAKDASERQLKDFTWSTEPGSQAQTPSAPQNPQNPQNPQR